MSSSDLVVRDNQRHHHDGRRRRPSKLLNRMEGQLAKRREAGSLRTLRPMNDFVSLPQHGRMIDFSSNDYLGLAQCPHQKAKVDRAYEAIFDPAQPNLRSNSSSNNNNMFSFSSTSPPSLHFPVLGATGSRLLSGDSEYCRALETWLARIHRQTSATLFNSGYDANLSVLSSLIFPNDIVILDELVHNSMMMGVAMSRLPRGTYLTFPHNNTQALQQLLQTQRRQHPDAVCLIFVESVYSMEGSVAPLSDLLHLASRYEADLVVDEAHGLGVLGEGGRGGLSGWEDHPNLLCAIYTFGKAAGCHGAAVCGSSPVLQPYLWNYARPFIYSTALPLHSLVTIRCSYETMLSREGERRRRHVANLIDLFQKLLKEGLAEQTRTTTRTTTVEEEISLVPSRTPIQALRVPGNDRCVRFCGSVQTRYGIRLYPIRSPTVPAGQERVRIILHAHNSNDDVRFLCQILLETVKKEEEAAAAGELPRRFRSRL